MGVIADAITAYAQPLLDQTDGSIEQLNNALAITQLCYNLAMLPEEERETALSEMKASLGKNDLDFDEFRRSIVEPMIRRHEDMFPGLHRRDSGNPWLRDSAPPGQPKPTASAKGDAEPEPYAPCPCGSGEKYKFCCRSKRRR